MVENNVLNIEEVKKKPRVVKLAGKVKEYGIDISKLTEDQVNKILTYTLLAIR